LRRHLESIVIVDEGERAGVLPRDIAEGRSHRPEGRWHADGLFHDELALLDDHLFRLTGSEERGLAEPLGPERLLDTVTLEIDGEEKIVDVVHQEGRLAVLGAENEGVEAYLFIVA